VGHYTVTAEKTGFKKIVRENIEIRIAQRQALDLQLEIGDVKESVQVSAQQQLLDTETSEVGETFSPKFMNTLPLWAGGLRNPESFVSYMAGVNNGSEVSIAGSTGRARESLIDGTSQVIPESGGVVFNFPSAEQFGEFKLLTGTYTAEYGRVGGGIEVFTTKSGTNGLHGTGVYSVRRDIFDAAGWTNNSNIHNAPGFRPKERYNNAAGGIGGPVYIPHVYDGRNKTFWFFSDDNDLRPATIAYTTNTLPTALMTQGNFSEWQQVIYDPATTSGSGASATRTPFPGNVIPTSRFSKISSNIIPSIPATNLAGITNNHSFVNTTTLTDHVWSLKIDHNFSDRNRLSYFQSLDNNFTGAVSDFNGPLGTGLGQQNQKPQSFRVNHDFTFSPTVLLHTSWGFTRQQQTWGVPAQLGFGSKVGFPGLTGDSDATPVIQFAGIDGLTAWGMQQGKVQNGSQLNWTNEFTQGLTWVHGKHEFKMGWDMRHLRTFGHDLAGSNGTYVFARNETASPSALATSGNSFASFLLGLPDSAGQTATPVLDGNIRYQYYGFYFQDNWKVLPRLTLNLGLRYEIPINWTSPIMSSVDLTLPNPGANNYPGALIFPGAGPGKTGNTRFWPTDFSDIGPRAGFAFQVTQKTVLRGGFGIFYESTSNGGCGCTLGANGSRQVNSDGLNAPFAWENPIPTPPGYHATPYINPTVGNGTDVDFMGPTFGKAPRIYTWSFNLQREVGHFLIDLGYEGNRGHRLNSTLDLNQVNPSYLSLGPLLQQQIGSPQVAAAGFTKPYASFPDNGTLAQALRPFPQFQGVFSRNSGLGQTWYDALTVKVERRFGDWQFTGSYVWSKSLSQFTYRQIFSQSQVWPQDMYNLTDDKSYLPFDQPQVVNILNSYDLPFGRGKHFLSTDNRIVNGIVGHWTISSVQQYRSGALIQASSSDTLGNGVLFTRSRRADVTGAPISTGAGRTSLDPNNPNSRWLNTAAFTTPGQYEFGNSAAYYGAFRDPSFFNENVGLIKEITVVPHGDRSLVRIELSADAFNVFNRTDFGNVNGSVGNVNFGRPTGPRDGPRIITMGFRLNF
ncbi:MAG: TonB-dependent receptor, partial [Bryobacteraceae bacterium]